MLTYCHVRLFFKKIVKVALLTLVGATTKASDLLPFPDQEDPCRAFTELSEEISPQELLDIEETQKWILSTLDDKYLPLKAPWNYDGPAAQFFENLKIDPLDPEAIRKYSKKDVSHTSQFLQQEYKDRIISIVSQKKRLYTIFSELEEEIKSSFFKLTDELLWINVTQEMFKNTITFSPPKDFIQNKFNEVFSNEKLSWCSVLCFGLQTNGELQRIENEYNLTMKSEGSPTTEEAIERYKTNQQIYTRRAIKSFSKGFTNYCRLVDSASIQQGIGVKCKTKKEMFEEMQGATEDETERFSGETTESEKSLDLHINTEFENDEWQILGEDQSPMSDQSIKWVVVGIEASQSPILSQQGRKKVGIKSLLKDAFNTLFIFP